MAKKMYRILPLFSSRTKPGKLAIKQEKNGKLSTL